MAKVDIDLDSETDREGKQAENKEPQTGLGPRPVVRNKPE